MFSTLEKPKFVFVWRFKTLTNLAIKWQRSNLRHLYIYIPGLTWHTNHTMHHKLPYKKKQAIVIPLVSCFFFYGHSMESLSAINLYGQLMILMLFCMFIQCFSCFSNMAFYETPVFALWHQMQLVFFSMLLYGSNGWKDGSFFSVWRIKKEVMVSRFSIIRTIRSNVWFVWNHTYIWNFKNMQSILWCILCPVYDTHVCHTFVLTVYDIHATIRHHIWLSIYFLFFVWWSTRVYN